MLQETPIERFMKMVSESEYTREAYCFVLEMLENLEEEEIPASELCKRITEKGLEDFGLLFDTVFEAWGITQSEDWGTVVFNLVNGDFIGVGEEDSADDFKNSTILRFENGEEIVAPSYKEITPNIDLEIELLSMSASKGKVEYDLAVSYLKSR